MNRTPVITGAAIAATAALGLAGCGSSDAVVVGGKDFTEQLVLCEMTVIALEEADIPAENSCNLQGTVAAREALLADEIDLYWEYTGTGWITHLGNADPVQDPQEQFDVVAEADLENDVRWLEPYAPFNNTYALAATQAVIDETGITTLSQLAEANNAGEEIGICVESEFAVRNDGLPGLAEAYGTTFAPDQVSELATGAIYQATADQECQFGEVFTTDGRIATLDLVTLEDDLAFFPNYNPAPNVTVEALEANPEIETVLAPISEALTNEAITELNGRVDDAGETPEDVARDWLETEGLIG